MEPNKPAHSFSPEVRSRAIRMVVDHRAEYGSAWAAICSIAAKFGCTAEAEAYHYAVTERFSSD